MKTFEIKANKNPRVRESHQYVSSDLPIVFSFVKFVVHLVRDSLYLRTVKLNGRGQKC